MKKLFLILVLFKVLVLPVFGQKMVEHKTYTWVSINSSLFINKHFYIQADAHLRENNVFTSTSFLFARLGLGYQVDNQLSFSVGYANLLLSPTKTGWSTLADEERIFEQVQLTTEYRKVKILQRIRNEQRWRDIIVNDAKTGERKFNNRLRYLLSANIPIFKNKKLPQLSIADELAVQFGKDVIYNTFEQNRIFIGVKQKITHSLSFDAGYMNVFQQKSSINSYENASVIRLFFYYTLK